LRVAVFGLGYVGSVTAAALAARGHRVIGVDIAAAKVDGVNAGRAPVVEPGLDRLLRDEVAAGRLSATNDGGAAVAESDLSLVCVGTPSRRNGSLDTEGIVRVARTIGGALARAPRHHVVAVRSTVVPGTTEELLVPELERASGLRAGVDFGVAVNPEFLREGTSLDDFNHPSRTVIGELDTRSGDVIEAIYQDAGVPAIRMRLRSAEMAKYVDNAFHAVKISFANEIGAFCAAAGVDCGEVMESFFADTKLNLSSAYLTPGFAFGGSCLPKDLRALNYEALHLDLDLPVIRNVLASNEGCISRLVDAVSATGRRRVGLLGLSFKPQTDDLRESPFVEVAERLLGKGYDIKIFDPVVLPARLVGANQRYIDAHLPHLSALLAESAEDVITHAEVCVVGAATADAVDALAARSDCIVLDPGRVLDHAQRGPGDLVSVAG
jgi:GDP-mannose 6-dehydrogenase